jgi:NarL family two-component system response regulator LiaR
MKRHVLLYGVLGGLLVVLLRLTEYRFLVIEHSSQIYGALIAAIFASLGIWLGTRWTARRAEAAAIIEPAIEAPQSTAPITQQFAPNNQKRTDLQITPRELEILGLVAEGLSNREIATRLFVSENTVKTHCSRAFDKLGAKRRTQAVQLSKEFGLIQ